MTGFSGALEVYNGKSPYSEQYIIACQQKSRAFSSTGKFCIRVSDRFPNIDNRHISLPSGIAFSEQKLMHIVGLGTKTPLCEDTP